MSDGLWILLFWVFMFGFVFGVFISEIGHLMFGSEEHDETP